MSNTVQHLSYAGITLPLTPSFLEDKWYKIVHNLYDHKFAEFWNWDRPNSDQLPTSNLPIPPDFSLGKLTWPTGAANPAWFHCIVETNRLNQITAVCAPNGYNTPQPLVFFDGRTGKTITASMYALPARPLNQLGNLYNDLWLLTLTDQRFYWFYAKGNITTPSSWSNLYSQLANALGVTITPDSISSNYGTPSTKWVLPYQSSTPAILDAVANQIGQRVVVSLSGVVTTVNWTTARTAAQNYYNNINNALLSGGLIPESSIAKYVPSSVQTLFLDASVSPPASVPYIINNTLSSLAISEYGSATGVPNYLQTLYADTQYNGSNFTAVTDYAIQAATDWYGWRLVDTDLVYPGIEPWVPTGWEDCIEWTLKLIEQNPALPDSPTDDPYSKTQIRRGPWIDFQVGGYLAGYQESGGGVTISGTPYTTPQFTSGGTNIQSIPQYTYVNTFASGNVVNQYTVPSISSSTSTSLINQYILNASGSSPNYTQYTAIYGLTGNTYQQYQLTPNLSLVQYTIDNKSLFQGVTPSGGTLGNILQYVIGGNSGLTQGIIAQPTYDGSGNVTQYQLGAALYNGSTTVSAPIQYTVSGSQITETYPSNATLNLSAATVILPSASTGVRTEGVIAAGGTTQGTATPIPTDTIKVTGASGTNGVSLPNNAAEICIVWNSGTSSLNVYPPSGAAIATSSVNAALSQAQKTVYIYTRLSSTQWTYQPMVGGF